MEVFSSIQGEGLLVGKRQIFIRFAGCNLNCSYCDTPESRDPSCGEELSADQLQGMVENLVTPDFHSLSITGGEPLLYPDFIREFLEDSPGVLFLKPTALSRPVPGGYPTSLITHRWILKHLNIFQGISTRILQNPIYPGRMTSLIGRFKS